MRLRTSGTETDIEEMVDAVLVTADQHYYGKAQRYGSISLLTDFSV
ncbi:MAG: hypothetical protein WKH97_07975 [Casimicrobiaceae bacterium]